MGPPRYNIAIAKSEGPFAYGAALQLIPVDKRLTPFLAFCAFLPLTLTPSAQSCQLPASQKLVTIQFLSYSEVGLTIPYMYR